MDSGGRGCLLALGLSLIIWLLLGLTAGKLLHWY